jgi:phage-related protein
MEFRGEVQEEGVVQLIDGCGVQGIALRDNSDESSTSEKLKGCDCFFHLCRVRSILTGILVSVDLFSTLFRE